MPSAPAAAPQVSFSDTRTAFSSRSNARMRKMYWLFALMNQPVLVKMGTGLTGWALKAHLPVKGLIKSTIFEQFCGGENIQECLPVVAAMGKYRVGTILDYSVEGEDNEPTFDATAKEIIATINTAAGNPHIPFSVFKITGVARFALLEKMQAGQALPPAEQQEAGRALARVDAICQAAHRQRVRLFIDAEETWIQDVIDRWCYDMMARYNREQPIVFNTYQLYRRASLRNLEQALQVAAREGYFFGAKLVRGAYMEKERARASRMGYADPIQPDKAASDRDFNAGVMLCLDNLHFTAFCAGTHNEASCQLLVSEMQRRSIAPGDERIWFSQLYGMSDNLSFNLGAAGYNVAKYLPYGPVEAVMPYLIRRAQENTSVAGQSSREFELIKREIERRKREGA